MVSLCKCGKPVQQQCTLDLHIHTHIHKQWGMNSVVQRLKTIKTNEEQTFETNLWPPWSPAAREQTTPALYSVTHFNIHPVAGHPSCTVPCQLIGLVRSRDMAGLNGTTVRPLWRHSSGCWKPEESLPAKHCSSRKADEAATPRSQSLHNLSACEKIDVTTQLRLFLICKIEVRTLHRGRGCTCEKIWRSITFKVSVTCFKAFWLVAVKIIRRVLSGEWSGVHELVFYCACTVWAYSHHLLCDRPTALTEQLQLRLGSLLVDFPVPALGEGGCTNSVTPTASFSLQIACVLYVYEHARARVCEQQLCEQLSIIACFICAHNQTLKSVSNLSEAIFWPLWELFRETLLYKWLQKKKINKTIIKQNDEKDAS